jgi:hypothetical protein
MSYNIGFGKHRLKTLEWLFFNDPGYAWWIMGTDAQGNFKGGARARLDLLVRRAKHLAIPGKCVHCSEPVSRMSLTEHPIGGIARVDFFCSKCHHDGSDSVLTEPSFYTPDIFRNYDKIGAKFLVAAIKSAYFGAKVRMTQKKMEEFFDNPDNFINP